MGMATFVALSYFANNTPVLISENLPTLYAKVIIFARGYSGERSPHLFVLWLLRIRIIG